MRGQAGCVVRRLLRLIPGYPEEKPGMYVTVYMVAGKAGEMWCQGCSMEEIWLKGMFSPWFPGSSFCLQCLRLKSREVKSWASNLLWGGL